MNKSSKQTTEEQKKTKIYGPTNPRSWYWTIYIVIIMVRSNHILFDFISSSCSGQVKFFFRYKVLYSEKRISHFFFVSSYIGPASCMIALFITIVLLSLPISKRLDQSSMMMDPIKMEINQSMSSMITDDHHELSIVDWNTYVILPLCLIISLLLLAITTIMSLQFHLSINHRSQIKT